MPTKFLIQLECKKKKKKFVHLVKKYRVLHLHYICILPIFFPPYSMSFRSNDYLTKLKCAVISRSFSVSTPLMYLTIVLYNNNNLFPVAFETSPWWNWKRRSTHPYHKPPVFGVYNFSRRVTRLKKNTVLRVSVRRAEDRWQKTNRWSVRRSLATWEKKQ